MTKTDIYSQLRQALENETYHPSSSFSFPSPFSFLVASLRYAAIWTRIKLVVKAPFHLVTAVFSMIMRTISPFPFGIQDGVLEGSCWRKTGYRLCREG